MARSLVLGCRALGWGSPQLWTLSPKPKYILSGLHKAAFHSGAEKDQALHCSGIGSEPSQSCALIRTLNLRQLGFRLFWGERGLNDLKSRESRAHLPQSADPYQV